MWELITLPFRLAWSVLTVAWDIVWGCVSPVSYTHLDVYKRQV